MNIHKILTLRYKIKKVRFLAGFNIGFNLYTVFKVKLSHVYFFVYSYLLNKFRTWETMSMALRNCPKLWQLRGDGESLYVGWFV